jgi:pimeloyl-ACP methyl ester carboxylesterase
MGISRAAQWLQRLSVDRQLIRFDPRGSGLSDRDDDSRLDVMPRDIETVVRETGLKRFALLGQLSSTPNAILYAAAHPEAVSDFSGGDTRIGVMPPVPSGLQAVSYYHETTRQLTGAGTLGVDLPLLKPVSDPSSIALYTYTDGKWERIADVVIRDIGTVVAEATFESTFPENYAVLQTTH